MRSRAPGHGRAHGRAALPMLGLLLAACASFETHPGQPAFAELHVDPARAQAGGPVSLTLVNRSERDIGYNLCPAVLDRRVGDEWRLHPETPAEVCTMELRILRPGVSAAFLHTLPAALPAGTYRFRVAVEWPLGEGRAGVASHAFEVRR